MTSSGSLVDASAEDGVEEVVAFDGVAPLPPEVALPEFTMPVVISVDGGTALEPGVEEADEVLPPPPPPPPPAACCCCWTVCC